MAREAHVPEVEAMESQAVLGHAAVALLGASLLALSPSLAPSDSGYQALPQLAAVVGALLVGWSANVRLPALLAALGFVFCLAAFASTVAGAGLPLVQRSSIGLLCASAILMGAAVRGPWVAPLFLFAPLAIEQVATGTWNLGRAEFSAQWAAAIGCDCPVAGFPAGLAVLGGLLGRATAFPPKWPRPSAFAPLVAALCVFLAGAVAATVLPDGLAFWRDVGGQAMVLAGALGWMALCYQLGTWWSALDGFLASLFILGGAAYAGQDLVRAVSLPNGLLLAFVVSLVPAALAAVAVLMRTWLTGRRHRMAKLVESRNV